MNKKEKVVYLAIMNVPIKWSMPIRNWMLLLNTFSIDFEGRPVNYV